MCVCSLCPDAAADIQTSGGGDADEDFLPLDDHVEQQQDGEEHIDRHQVSPLMMMMMQARSTSFTASCRPLRLRVTAE